MFLQRKFLIFLRNDSDCKVFVQKKLSRHNKKTDTTAQLYCTLSTYITPKAISRQNQKTVLKEYYDYSIISTLTESSQYF
jgi:hypothetical protein